jgi:hypothetical protein
VARDQRYAAHHHRFGVGPRWFEVDARNDGADHLGHLSLGERRADAAADAAAEREP